MNTITRGEKTRYLVTRTESLKLRVRMCALAEWGWRRRGKKMEREAAEVTTEKSR